jgi:hypothetical protein
MESEKITLNSQRCTREKREMLMLLQYMILNYIVEPKEKMTLAQK